MTIAVDTLTLQDRADAYAKVYPHWPASRLARHDMADVLKAPMDHGGPDLSRAKYQPPRQTRVDLSASASMILQPLTARQREVLDFRS